MGLEVKGTVKTVGETKEFGRNNTPKRDLIVDTGGEYPQEIKLEFVKDKCDLLDNLSPGDAVNVHFNLRGNEHNGRHYVNLHGWKIEKV